MTLRKQMQSEGYRARKVLCGDDNGGLPLVSGWVVLRPGQDTPRPGEVTGGHRTREAAWRVAEDHYERMTALPR